MLLNNANISATVGIALTACKSGTSNFPDDLLILGHQVVRTKHFSKNQII
jgi:hypothetical protein